MPSINGRQNYFFDGVKFSAQDFYNAVEEGITRRDIPNIKMSRVNFYETSILSAKREYLRISREHQTFDICAAPFGTGFFVSWWQGEQSSWMDGIPFLEQIGHNKTYYQLDTDTMYKAGIKAAVNEAIDKMSPCTKGMRMLNEVESSATHLAS